jgi:methyl-accepting chemotaxis protein
MTVRARTGIFQNVSQAAQQVGDAAMIVSELAGQFRVVGNQTVGAVNATMAEVNHQVKILDSRAAMVTDNAVAAAEAWRLAGYLAALAFAVIAGRQIGQVVRGFLTP